MRSYLSRTRRAGVGLACLIIVNAATVNAADAPAALTLDGVLALADAAHPDLDLARAQEQAARAEAQFADSLNDLRVTLEGALRSGRNEVYQDRFHPDHYARLVARKPLFDAGRAEASQSAATQDAGARTLLVEDVRAQRRITLMARFFDVLLAEMQDHAETEFLANAYVNWDHAKERETVGLSGRPELAELEARYQDARARRDDTRRKMREKRMQLGLAMGREGVAYDELIDPVLTGNERALPEFDVLVQHALTHNKRLRALSAQLAAARSRVDAARAEYRPTLEFEAETAAWSRASSTRDDVRAGVNLVIPLWQGGRQDAALAREHARIAQLQAQQQKTALDLREAVQSIFEEIQLLRDAERRSAEINAQYRDVALAKARAEYEMELRASLGVSMSETQAAKSRLRSVEYRLALAWARLDALLGTPLLVVKSKDTP